MGILLAIGMAMVIGPCRYSITGTGTGQSIKLDRLTGRTWHQRGDGMFHDQWFQMTEVPN